MPHTLEAAETTASARLRGVSAMVWLTMCMLLSLVRCWQHRFARALRPFHDVIYLAAYRMQSHQIRAPRPSPKQPAKGKQGSCLCYMSKSAF